jgi:hypothetical protein
MSEAGLCLDHAGDFDSDAIAESTDILAIENCYGPQQENDLRSFYW